jgi:hypothetical protein
MESKLGIEEVKQVLDLALAGVSVGASAMKDGHLGVEDLGYLMQLVPVVGPAVAGASKVPAELADLSEEEAAEVVAYVMAKLAIDNAKAVLVIEKALKTAVSVYELAKAIKSEAPAPVPAA